MSACGCPVLAQLAPTGDPLSSASGRPRRRRCTPPESPKRSRDSRTLSQQCNRAGYRQPDALGARKVTGGQRRRLTKAAQRVVYAAARRVTAGHATPRAAAVGAQRAIPGCDDYVALSPLSVSAAFGPLRINVPPPRYRLELTGERFGRQSRRPAHRLAWPSPVSSCCLRLRQREVLPADRLMGGSTLSCGCLPIGRAGLKAAADDRARR
jgi:hypothetical protein